MLNIFATAGRNRMINAIERAAAAARPNHVRLDDVDTAILRELVRDARIPNNALAEKVGIAPSTALARMRALRESGVIKGFQADIDLETLRSEERRVGKRVSVRVALGGRRILKKKT